jgi:hypothetical protein
MMTTWSAIPTLDRVFDEVLRSTVLRSTFRGNVGAGPRQVAADIRERDDAYIFQFDVPGVRPRISRSRSRTACSPSRACGVCRVERMRR